MSGKIIYGLLIALVLSACAPDNRVYKKRLDLSPNVEWKLDDVKAFTFEIQDTTLFYELIVDLRYITGFPFDLSILDAKFTAPDGSDFSHQYQLKIRKENGEYIGDPGLDLWDVEQVIEEKFKFEQLGKYTISFTHAMPIDPLPYVLELGLVVNKK